MTSLRHGDRDLHDADGSHLSTSPSTSEVMIAAYERRLARHLHEHRTDPERLRKLADDANLAAANTQLMAVAVYFYGVADVLHYLINDQPPRYLLAKVVEP